MSYKFFSTYFATPTEAAKFCREQAKNGEYVQKGEGVQSIEQWESGLNDYHEMPADYETEEGKKYFDEIISPLIEEWESKAIEFDGIKEFSKEN
jgi:hypothetical protein